VDNQLKSIKTLLYSVIQYVANESETHYVFGMNA